MSDLRRPGARPGPDGVDYCVWAPDAHAVSVYVEPPGVVSRRLEMTSGDDGYHYGHDDLGRAGDAYGFQFGGGPVLPDPCSRLQQKDVHGLSLVVESGAYRWRTASWQRPPFRDLVIYEIHVGTFTTEGSFRAAIARLPYVSALGVTAIELMPIADFPGSRNWGYDGVLIYAPARAYGSPDDLRDLVDAAHEHGLAVILDVVYNHLGPDGNYLAAYSNRYFNERHHTPWGAGFNFDAGSCEPVRRFFCENPIYWIEEFRIDGFRFDAANEIPDDSPIHILAEMTAAVHERGGYCIAEDARNDAGVVSTPGLGFDALWADDFHHALHVSQTAERFSYFQDYAGTAEEIAAIVSEGWLYQGQQSSFAGRSRGTKCAHLPPQKFVHCISNHDQTGNRALGERLHHLISPAAYRAISVLLCLSPYTPLLFMGQEWAASSPFLFFTDHHAELGKLVTAGRRREFAGFPEFGNPDRIPDPQSKDTAHRSTLDWREIVRSPHAEILELYRACLRLRRDNPAFRPTDRLNWSATSVDSAPHTFVIRGAFGSLWIHLGQGGTVSLRPGGELSLSSEEARFGGSGRTAGSVADGQLHFTGPESLLFS